MSSSKQAEARAKGILAKMLKQRGWLVEFENLDDWLGIIKDVVKRVPMCLECGNFMVERRFVDSRDAKNKPCDVNRDFYCPNCGLRWAETPPPHEFFEEGH